MSKDVKSDEATEIVEDDQTRDDEKGTGDTVADDAGATSEATESDVEHVDAETAETEADTAAATSGAAKSGVQWSRVVAFVVLPALALVLAAGAGYLKWRDNSVRSSELAAATSVQAARDSTIALLSYKPDTVEQQLTEARDRLTGEFRDYYTTFTNDVVIPGSQQQKISAIATVPEAASVSADPAEAVVLVFVNQTVQVGADAPTDTASSVRVTLEKVDDRWLISKFDPV